MKCKDCIHYAPSYYKGRRDGTCILILDSVPVIGADSGVNSEEDCKIPDERKAVARRQLED